MTQLLAALNVQELDAIVYRGSDDDRIGVGEIIKGRNSADIRQSDLVVALVSSSYCKSGYCRHEAMVAVQERDRRSLPILVAIWPTASANHSLWPAEIQELLIGSGNNEQMYLCVSKRVDEQEGDVKQLAEDICNALGVEYDDQPDPVGRMHLIKRTRRAVRIFPSADTSHVDGDLRLVLLSLRNIHLLIERGDIGHQGAFKTIAALLVNTREICERTLGPRTAGYLHLGEAVFLLQEARIAKDPSKYKDLCMQVQVAAEKALRVGDLFTQRDAYIVLGNLALENDKPEEALEWHLDASKVAQLIEGEDVSLAAACNEVRHRIAAISRADASAPMGVSAYVMFDNLMKCQVRLMHPPELRIIESRVREWRAGVAYSDPEHFSRYGSLLVFGFAFAGCVDEAIDLLTALEAANDGHAMVHMQTWRILLTLTFQGLCAKESGTHRNLWKPTEWLSSCSYDRRTQSPREVALINAQASHILRIVASVQHGLRPMGRAIGMFPNCIRLRVERALLLLSMGKSREANKDCMEAIGNSATILESVMPFHEAEDSSATLYAQGVAFWFLGRRQEAEDRFQLSQAPVDQHYDEQFKGAFGAAR